MSIIRKIADRIELYDPRTGERFLNYNETDDEVTVDKPLNAGSVNAKKLPNAPKLVAQEYRILTERTVNTARAKSTTSGSGGTTGFGDTCQVKTGSTPDSFARLAFASNDVNYSTFNNDVVVRLSINVRAIGGDADDEMYVVIAGNSLPSANDYTPQHIGIGVVAGDLVASSADGSTQETTTIISNVNTGQRTAWLVWSASDGILEVYDNALPPENTADASQSTNVPSGAVVKSMAVMVENGTNGNSNQWRMSEYTLGVGR